MATILYWPLAAVASLMMIGTLLTGLFVWRMWVRPAKPARIDGSASPGEPSEFIRNDSVPPEIGSEFPRSMRHSATGNDRLTNRQSQPT
jgi:hypothetical protein